VLVDAINSVKEETGVEASTDREGNLVMRSMDGRGFTVSSSGGTALAGINSTQVESYGNLTLTKLDASDVIISAGALGQDFGASVGNVAETNVNLQDVVGEFDANVRSAIGGNEHNLQRLAGDGLGTGVQTLKGAMVTMDIAEAATNKLDEIRADLGSVQNQLTSTINNISVTQVNVQAAESQIRDVDFAAESSNFQKHNILAQSGSYAMSQANAVQQNVLKLLQ
jgi:flagellin